MTEPSSRYFAALDATKAFHATHKTFNGRFFLRYIEDVKAIIDAFGCKTLLDYGAGKGKQWDTPINDPSADPPLCDGQAAEDQPPLFAEEYLGVTVTKYDPAWPPFAKEPTGKFDIVVCTQVLGSIPIIDLPWAVDRLYSFANKAVFVGERLGPVKKLVHAHMRAEMPYEWTWDQWAAMLRRPDHPEIACFLKATDGRPGAMIGETRLQ